MIRLSQVDWDAIVAYVRYEERILMDSYGIPRDKERTWLKEYREQEPEGAKLQEGAIAAIQRAGKPRITKMKRSASK